jgi:hypothetical protein
MMMLHVSYRPLAVYGMLYGAMQACQFVARHSGIHMIIPLLPGCCLPRHESAGEAASSVQQVRRIAQIWQQADLLLNGDVVLAQIWLASGDLASAEQALQQVVPSSGHVKRPSQSSLIERG